MTFSHNTYCSSAVNLKLFLIFLLLIIIHEKLSTAQECSTLLVWEEFLPKPVGCIFGNTNHCKTRADQLSQRKASKVSKNPQEPFIS